ncbi:hypothetical protein EDD29_2057 [Actinocorallia herbida]|uniref:HTH cro/C1-type domain-containing protein n=1 Tax=Actinocorallia herbida TaxID=58109 RepID=A0A3N1CTA8_9ACTN|nr:helix-turn-helix transcriptional regulator [Actinocorallia herbida]ROO84530.1 hypothetical protein EDD29_2057 [Actinocorallia herbida]
MYGKERPDPSSSVAALVANRVWFHRTQKGMTGSQLGDLIGVGKAAVSKIEHGNSPLADDQAEALDREWATGGLFKGLVHLARITQSSGWFAEHLEQERRALVIKQFHPTLVPGLLQTPEYARSVLELGEAQHVERRLNERLERQAALNRANPPTIRVILDQGVLDRTTPDPAIRLGQLRHLAELTEFRHIILRVVPRDEGIYPGIDGPLRLLTLPTGDVGYVETPAGGRLVTDPGEVRSLLGRFDRIGDHALTTGASRTLLSELIKEAEK